MANDPLVTKDEGERLIRSIESLARIMHETGLVETFVWLRDGYAHALWFVEPDGEPVGSASRPIDDLRTYDDVEMEWWRVGR